MTDTDALEFGLAKSELKFDKLVEMILRVTADLAKQSWAAGVTAGFWPGVGKELVGMAEQVAKMPLATILVGAWKRHKKFAQYREPQSPPDKISRVPVATHHITSTHRPYIDITVNGRSEGKVSFELELDVAVDTGILTIQNGRFMRIEGGRLKVTGKLKCEGVVVAEKASRDFAWSDGMVLGGGAGIPIDALI